MEVLRTLLDQIAKNNNYVDYKTTITPISSGGANYSSQLYVATISDSAKEDLNLFAKVISVSEKLRETVPVQAFTNENYFYKEVLTKYKEIEDKYGIPPDHRLVSAKYYASSDEYMKEILILENLAARSFSSFDRFQAFDWSYASYSIKQLAIFHSLSTAYYKEYSSNYEYLVSSRIYEYPADTMTQLLLNGLEQALKVVKEENRERLFLFFNKPENQNPIHKLVSRSSLPVIIHGDYRPSNMMHKVLNDGTIQVITLDFQTLLRGHPVVDLLYFLLCGSDKVFRKQYFQKSLDLYYNELTASLRRFGLDPDMIYSRNEFDDETKRFLPLMVLYIIPILLIITVDENDAPNIGDIDMDGFSVGASKLFTERFNDLVDDCIQLGVL